MAKNRKRQFWHHWILLPLGGWRSMEQTIILKTDRLGRVRTPRERQEEIVGAWRASGLSAMRFAETIGVKYQTLAAWIRRGRRSREGGAGLVCMGPRPGGTAPGWLEVAAGHAGAMPLRVELTSKDTYNDFRCPDHAISDEDWDKGLL